MTVTVPNLDASDLAARCEALEAENEALLNDANKLRDALQWVEGWSQRYSTLNSLNNHIQSTFEELEIIKRHDHAPKGTPSD